MPGPEASDTPKPPELGMSPVRAGCLYQLTALCAGAFLITVLAMIASAFGDAKSSAAAWLDRNAGRLMAVEVTAILLIGFSAMACDRTRSSNSDGGKADESPPATPES